MNYFIFTVTRLCLSVVKIIHILNLFVYNNKSDFSDTEKTFFFCEPEKAVLRRTQKIALTCRPDKAIFRDRKYTFYLAI